MWYRLVLAVFFLLPGISSAAEINAGFVNGLWYSDDSIFAGETARVYVAIRNNTDADLTGVVTFYDNDKKIGSQSVAALDGRIIESWIDWKPAYGEHTMRAELSRLKLSAIGTETEQIDVVVATASDTIFIDYDTDSDNTGNTTDSDDDGDSVSDTEETENNTDPLIKNSSVVQSETTSTSATLAGEPNSNTDASQATLEEEGGIERFLTPSRADTLLTSVTTWTDATKQKIDDYRQKRKEALYESTPAVVVNNDGFGEITRTNAQEQQSELPASDRSVIADIIKVVGTILGGIFTAILATLSWVLNYSILIQLFILIGILAGIYFTARKMGSRPIKKKK